MQIGDGVLVVIVSIVAVLAEIAAIGDGVFVERIEAVTYRVIDLVVRDIFAARFRGHVHILWPLSHFGRGCRTLRSTERTPPTRFQPPGASTVEA